MDDPRDIGMRRSYALHSATVSNVDAMERKSRRLLKYREPGFLQCRIIVVVNDIDADHRLSAVEQFTAGVKANKSGRTRYQICHFLSCFLSRRITVDLSTRISHSFTD